MINIYKNMRFMMITQQYTINRILNEQIQTKLSFSVFYYEIGY